MPFASIQNFTQSIGGRILIHLLFWFGVSAFFIFFFSHFNKEYHYTFLFVCLLMPIAIATTYFINYVLIPRYLLQKRYARFAFYFISTMIFSVWSEMLVMLWALINLADYRYQNMDPLSGNIFFLAVGLYFVVFFSTSVKLLQQWYSSEKNVSELRSRKLEAELKLKEAELQLLKGQIHPHFLFNTLNNLYGLALEKSDQMPDVIIRLSSLLDVLLYRNQAQKVPLDTELQLIKDYIALEKLRVEDRLQLYWEEKGARRDYQLPSFLLFPFVENAFKHGFSGNTQRLWLKVHTEIREYRLIFSVSNSVDLLDKKIAVMAGGIGLKNVRRRLELLYPGEHQLKVYQQPGKFRIELKINLLSENANAYATI